MLIEAFVQNSKAFKQVEVQYVPILLGGLMKVCGNTPPLKIKSMSSFVLRLATVYPDL